MKRRGFTLIELLVVIAIIAILAAILFPVFAKAREKARQTTCLSNLKQWALSLNMYITDWEMYPGTRNYYITPRWFPEVAMSSYGLNLTKKNNGWISNFLQCPSDGGQNYNKWMVEWGYEWVDTDYSRNTGIGYDWHWHAGWGVIGCNGWSYTRSESQLKNPSSTVAAMDGDYDEIYAAYPEGSTTWYAENSTAGPRTRHNEGLNAAFCDGHAKWRMQRPALSEYRDQSLSAMKELSPTILSTPMYSTAISILLYGVFHISS